MHCIWNRNLWCYWSKFMISLSHLINWYSWLKFEAWINHDKTTDNLISIHMSPLFSYVSYWYFMSVGIMLIWQKIGLESFLIHGRDFHVTADCPIGFLDAPPHTNNFIKSEPLGSLWDSPISLNDILDRNGIYFKWVAVSYRGEAFKLMLPRGAYRWCTLHLWQLVF